MADLSLAKLPWYGQLAVFVVLALVGAGAFYYLYDMPAQDALAKQAKDLSAIRGRISKAQGLARQLPEFKQQIATLEARLDTLKPILPDKRDAGDLLRRVQTLATQSNLHILGFRPQAITAREMHAEWPISLQLEGNYHNFALFLDRVSKFPRIINVSNIVLAAKEPPSPAASMTVTATATTFVFVEPPAAPAEDPTKKGKGAKKGPAAPASKP